MESRMGRLECASKGTAHHRARRRQRTRIARSYIKSSGSINLEPGQQ
jgi:hypothetical protein